ncbi:MAG TPA: AAA family ATPase, partial [Gemmatimonadaceae bacterium]|nr:AAA family ATPase [Gemmatimonadaceae bacterium]
MIRIRTLGTPMITVGKREVPPRARALFHLVLYMGLERGRRISRKDLAALIWGDADPEKANHSLRQTLYELRKAGARFSGDANYLQLSSDAVDIDVAVLESESTDAIETALSGDFLPNIDATDNRYSDWLDSVRERVNARRRRVLVDALLNARESGRSDRVETIARELRRVDPLNEEANCALAEVLAARGSKSEALSTIESYVREIGDEQHVIRLPAALLRERISRVAPTDPEQALTVGRDDTLFVIRTAMERALGNRTGSCIWLCGEPGIGKSHILAQIAKEAAIRGMITVSTDCPDRPEQRPLATLGELTQRLLRTPGALGCDPDALALLQRLSSEPGSLGNYPGTEGDAREAIATAFSDLLEAVSVEQPVLVQVDDAQWIDPASLTALQHVITQASSWPCVLTFGSRMRERFPIPPSVNFTLIPLETFNRATSEELARALMPGHAVNTTAIEWIARVSGGHPLHIVELTREVVRGNAGHVPQSLQELLRSKLRALSSDAENMLLAIVLLDNHASSGRVERLLGLDPSRLWNGLKALGNAGLIHDDGMLTRVRHDLIADALLGMTDPGVLRYAHHRIAQVLGEELRNRQGSVEMTWDSAQHWRSAGQPQQAEPLIRDCVQHLLEIGLFDDAIRLLHDFLADASSGNQRAFLLNELGFVHSSRGEMEQALTAFRKSKAEAVSPLPPRWDLTLTVADVEWKQGARTNFEAVQIYRDCVARDDVSIEVRLIGAMRILIIDDYTQDDALEREAFDVVTRLRARVLDSRSRRALLRAEIIHYSFVGDIDRAVDHAAQLIDVTRGLRSPLALSYAYTWFSGVSHRAGRIEDARTNLQEAIALTDRKYSPLVAAHARILLALLEIYHGSLDAACALLDQAQVGMGEANEPSSFVSTDYAIVRAKCDVERGRPELVQA